MKKWIYLIITINVIFLKTASAALPPWADYDKKVRSAEVVDPLKSDLFGDAINGFDGTVEFRHVDVDLPGNSNLPVSFSRKLKIRPILASSQAKTYGGAGDWEIEVPHLSGVFDERYGWSGSGSNPEPRCSSNFFPRTAPPSRIDDIFSGFIFSIPGDGKRSLIAVNHQQFVKQDGKIRKWTTSKLDSVSCTSMLGNYPGEGFVIETTSGIKYYLNVATERNAGAMGNYENGDSYNRAEIFFLASKIEDRYGNWVEYTYDNTPNRLPIAITASDGRQITITYSNGRVATVTASGRTWSYQYSTTGLSTVILPDASKWTFSSTAGMLMPDVYWTDRLGPGCLDGPPMTERSLSLTIGHPSGATGTFNFSHTQEYRSGIPEISCVAQVDTNQSTIFFYPTIPIFYELFAITSKTLHGPGLPSPLTWSYQYSGFNFELWAGSIPPCTTCPLKKTFITIEPDGSRRESDFGIVYMLNEGRLLGSRLKTPTGSIIEMEELTYLSDQDVPSMPFPPTYGWQWGGSDDSSVKIRPLVRRVVVRDGVQHSMVISEFDIYARPTRVTQSSAPTP